MCNLKLINMKRKEGFKVLGMIMVLFFGTIILSCNKQEIADIPDSNFSLKNGAILDEVCELTAGQTINAGNVVYSRVNGNLMVTYIPSNGWLLREVHLFVGCMDDFPINARSGAIKVGLFPYGDDDLSDADKWESDPIQLPDDCDDCIIAAHAVVYNESLGKEETAWANCTFKPVIALKARFNVHPEGKTYWTYGVTDGLSFVDECKDGNATGWWCDYLGYNPYVKDDVYQLQSEYYTDAGDVTVTDDGENLTVTVEADYDMRGAYLFVGTLEELCSFTERYDDCPDFYNFPYKKVWPDPGPYSNTHTFTIPLSDFAIGTNSVSFESGFGSARWGWFSYCY